MRLQDKVREERLNLLDVPLTRTARAGDASAGAEIYLSSQAG